MGSFAVIYNDDDTGEIPPRPVYRGSLFTQTGGGQGSVRSCIDLKTDLAEMTVINKLKRLCPLTQQQY